MHYTLRLSIDIWIDTGRLHSLTLIHAVLKFDTVGCLARYTLPWTCNTLRLYLSPKVAQVWVLISQETAVIRGQKQNDEGSTAQDTYRSRRNASYDRYFSPRNDTNPIEEELQISTSFAVSITSVLESGIGVSMSRVAVTCERRAVADLENST